MDFKEITTSYSKGVSLWFIGGTGVKLKLNTLALMKVGSFRKKSSDAGEDGRGQGGSEDAGGWMASQLLQQA